MNEPKGLAPTPTAHALLETIIDVWDDGQNNPPDGRCYIAGTWREVVDEARDWLLKNPIAASLAGGATQTLLTDEWLTAARFDASLAIDDEDGDLIGCLAWCREFTKIVLRLAAPTPPSPAEPAEFETAIATLRHLIDCLRRNGSYTDEEGEATDFLEPLLVARLSVSTEGVPVAKVTGADEYGPLLEWSTHWVELIGKSLYAAPPVAQALTYLDVLFDGPPSHESGCFVEVNDPSGKSVNAGEWIKRDDGLWALRIALLRTSSPTGGDSAG